MSEVAQKWNVLKKIKRRGEENIKKEWIRRLVKMQLWR